MNIDAGIKELDTIAKERIASGFTENHMRLKVSDMRRILIAMKNPEHINKHDNSPNQQASYQVEGGTTFTECDECWPITEPKQFSGYSTESDKLEWGYDETGHLMKVRVADNGLVPLNSMELCDVLTKLDSKKDWNNRDKAEYICAKFGATKPVTNNFPTNS